MIDLEFAEANCFAEIQARFISIAKTIFSEYGIELQCHDGERLKVTSLELYLYKTNVWEDPTVHGIRNGFEDQLSTGRWYLHHHSKGGLFAPKRIGIDITAGSKDAGIHAGLLVRGVDEIDGSARAVNSILFGKKSFSRPRNWNYVSEQKTFLKKYVHANSIYEGQVALVKAANVAVCNYYIGKKILGKSVKKIERRYLDCELRLATHLGTGLRLLTPSSVSP